MNDVSLCAEGKLATSTVFDDRQKAGEGVIVFPYGAGTSELLCRPVAPAVRERGRTVVVVVVVVGTEAMQQSEGRPDEKNQ